jgi:TolB-like protein
LVAAVAAALLGLAAFASLRVPRVRQGIFEKSPANTARQIKSLAVLPLANLTGDSDQDYFVDGMTDALITNLAEIASLRVISRTSAMHFKGRQKKLTEIAKELNVDAVLEGAVMRSGDQVRIDAQLIQADNEQRLWGKSYDRKIIDVLSLQSEVAHAIVAELHVKLASSEKKASRTPAQSVDPQAYETYLKGIYFLGHGEDAHLDKAVMYLEKAVNLDPKYAPANLRLAEAYSLLAYLEAGKIPPAEAWLKSESYIAKTLELDPDSSLAHALLGIDKLVRQCDRTGAEKELDLALKLDPNDMASLDYHSFYLLLIGQGEQAVAEKKRVVENDPLSTVATSELGMYLDTVGRTDEAIHLYQRTLELNPISGWTYSRLGWIYYHKGQYDEAVIQMKKALAVEKSPLWLGSLGMVYAKWGKTSESLAVIAELQEMSKQQQYVSPSQIARIYALLGSNDQAIAWLMKAKKRDLPLPSDEGFEGLRSDARFGPIEARLKLDRECERWQ